MRIDCKSAQPNARGFFIFGKGKRKGKEKMLAANDKEKVYTFNHNGYCIAIVEKEESYETWVSYEHYGFASRAFGSKKKQEDGSILSLQEFCKEMENQLLAFEDYYWQELEAFERY